MIDASPAIEAQDKVSARLVELGWARLDPASPNPLVRYALYLPGTADVLPAAWLMPRISERSGQAELGIAALLGFECPAARDVTTALLGRAYSGAVLRSPQLSARLVEGEQGVALAVEALVEFVVAQEADLSFADLDRVIEMLRHSEALPATNPSAALDTDDRPAPESSQREATEVAAAMLAALGRYRDARRTLASLIPTPEAEDDPLQARFLRQIGRWIDAAGGLPLPTSPAQWSPSHPVRPSNSPQSGTWSDHRDRAFAEQAAVAAARALSRGKGRSEIRALLERELQVRGLRLQQSAVEKHVDFLLETQSALGKARTAVRGIRAIAEFVKDARTSSGPLAPVLASERESNHDDFVDNAPLPARATYPVAALGDESAITIDSSATQYVEGIMRGRRNMGVRIWFSTEDGSSSIVAVHIGPRRVARLADLSAQRLAPPLAAAAERDELPWTYASLSNGPDGLELRLALPELNREPA